MSSPDVTRTRQSEPVDWRSLNQLDAQEAQAYPAGYEQARRRLVCHLLSTATILPEEDQRETRLATTRGSVVHDVDCETTNVPAEDCADRAEQIRRKAKRAQQQREEFHYVSSFDHLTSNEPWVDSQPAPLLPGRRVLKALAVAAALVVGTLIYASVGSAFPGLSEGVRTFLHNQEVRLIRPEQDVRNFFMAPPQMPPQSFEGARTKR